MRLVYVREGQQTIYIAMDDKGRELIVEPESGHWQQCEWRSKEMHQCRDSNDSRTWRAYQEPALRK